MTKIVNTKLSAVLLGSTICISLLLLNSRGLVQDKVPRPNTIFELPRLQAKVANLFREQKWEAAEIACREMIRIQPRDHRAHYNLACTLARIGNLDDAIASLTTSVENGFDDAEHARLDQDLEPLRERQEFLDALAKMESLRAKRNERANLDENLPEGIEPGVPNDGQVVVDQSNTVWQSDQGIFRSYFQVPEFKNETAIVNGFDEAGKLLTQWFADRTACGNHGDFYDNHDTDHSNMDYGRFPQLTRIEFSDSVRNAGLHHGLQTSFFYNQVTFGNSSTAVTGGPFWRSLPRLALTNGRHAAILVAQYHSNHLYVYPEHRDHDPGHNGLKGEKGDGFGDLYACNTPYLIISQGSSGSDRVFLNAIAATLGAFHPQVKQRLKETHLLMPTVQRLLRASMKLVPTDEDYFSGKAHPTVFDGNQLDIVRMITMAHDMTLDKIPPVVRIQVIGEEQATIGRDYFDGYNSEVLLNTPQAIARIARSTRYMRRMIVSAAASRDLQDRALQIRWVVLRGDADRIAIEPKDAAQSLVELRIPYHDRRSLNADPTMDSNRVDIGVFAICDGTPSAPAFVSTFYLDNEKRLYDDEHRIVSVDYADPVAVKNYVDPLISIPRSWRDEYRYDEQGKLSGWTRIRGDDSQWFTAEGKLATKRDGNDRVLESRDVRYVAQAKPNELPVLEQQLIDTPGSE